MGWILCCPEFLLSLLNRRLPWPSSQFLGHLLSSQCRWEPTVLCLHVIWGLWEFCFFFPIQCSPLSHPWRGSHKDPPYNASPRQRFSWEKAVWHFYTTGNWGVSHWQQSKTERWRSSVSPTLYQVALSEIPHCYLQTWVQKLKKKNKNHQTGHLNEAHIHFCLSFTKLSNGCCLLKDTTPGLLVAIVSPSHHH